MRTRPKAQTPIPAAAPADEHVYAQWSQARSYWCRDNGYTVLELLRAERPRPVPSKRKAVRTDQETP